MEGAGPGRVAAAAGALAAATLLSRALGYLRDALIAAILGAGLEADAFLAAFRIPNLFRRLLGEGTLSAAFVPVLTEAHAREGASAARSLAAAAARFLAVAGILACGAGILLAPWFVPWLAPGFTGLKLELTVHLTRVMLPYLVFAGLVSLAAAALNVRGCYGPPALAPSLLNAAMIGALAAAWLGGAAPASWLAAGVIAGGALQLVVQAPFLARHRMRLWGPAGFWHAALGRAARLAVPAVFGGAVQQVNILVATLLASLLAEGSVSYLYYADRVVEFPLGVVAAAGATAVLPAMARAAAVGDTRGLAETLERALRMVSFIALPATVGLILLAAPIVRLLFLRGAFDPAAVQLTAGALSYYAVGLWGFSLTRIVTAAFFALQAGRAPVVAGAAALGANLLFGGLLMTPMAHEGLALATSLASLVNLGFLLPAVRDRLPGLRWGAIAAALLQALVATAVMGLAVGGLAAALLSDPGLAGAALAARLAAVVASGLAVYAAAAAALRARELRLLIEPLRGWLCRR